MILSDGSTRIITGKEDSNILDICFLYRIHNVFVRRPAGAKYGQVWVVDIKEVKQ